MEVYRRALATALEAARAAAALLCAGLQQPGRAWSLDQAAEEILRTRLRGSNDWSYRSDEADYLPGPDRSHLWLVDPNDGTFYYNTGARGSAISIAALRDGLPILGVVYAFAFPDHDGDLLAWAEGCGPIQRNGTPITTPLIDLALDGPTLGFDSRMIVYLSPATDHFPHAAIHRCHPARYISIPSIAYRLALVAAGEGVGTLSLNSPCALDYAAGHALLHAAGGTFIDQDGGPIRYSVDGISTCTTCFAGSPQATTTLLQRPWTTPVADPPTAVGYRMLRRQRFGAAQRQAGRVIAETGVLARGQGCLLGQLAGDSLGGLVEFRDPKEIRRIHPEGCRELRDGGTWGNLAGQPTDDSELALLLARTLIRHRGYEEARVLESYLDWFHDPQTFDRGSTISKALSAAAAGKDHEERLDLIAQGASRGSQANGSLMRVSPLGIFAAGRPAEAADLARRDSQLTHPHPVCGDSCACFVAAIATAIATGCGPEGAYEAALDEAKRSSVESSVREALDKARYEPPHDFQTQMGWVLIALQNAFYRLLHAPTVEEGIVSTVMAGGDTDTTAAIAGALLGAVHGRKGIPGRWQRVLRSCRMVEGIGTRHPRAQEYWPVDILDLAECLLLEGGWKTLAPGGA